MSSPRNGPSTFTIVAKFYAFDICTFIYGVVYRESIVESTLFDVAWNGTFMNLTD